MSVTDHYNMYEKTLDNFNKLKLTHLSMLFTREFNVKLLEEWEDEFTEIDSSATDIDDLQSDSEMPRTATCISPMQEYDHRSRSTSQRS